LIGGALIGLASALFLLLDGRIAGVCGISAAVSGPPAKSAAKSVVSVCLFLGQ